MSMKEKIFGVVAVGAGVISTASAVVDTNVTDGVTLAGSLTNTALATWMQPPLAYVTGLVLFVLVFGVIAGVIKGHRGKKG